MDFRMMRKLIALRKKVTSRVATNRQPRGSTIRAGTIVSPLPQRSDGPDNLPDQRAPTRDDAGAIALRPWHKDQRPLQAVIADALAHTAKFTKFTTARRAASRIIGPAHHRNIKRDCGNDVFPFR